jgi:hypothetical protein
MGSEAPNMQQKIPKAYALVSISEESKPFITFIKPDVKPFLLEDFDSGSHICPGI